MYHVLSICNAHRTPIDNVIVIEAFADDILNIANKVLLEQPTRRRFT